jgi:hypothetical protein
MTISIVMTTYIYESPDKGDTVYRREFGNSEKTIIKEPTAIPLWRTQQDKVNAAIMLAKLKANEMYD